jgi:hypothetical protein
MKLIRLVLTAGLASLVGLALSACGSAPVTKTVTVTTTTAARATTIPSPHKQRGKRRIRTMRSCDDHIRAKRATTSCKFAQNVFYAYWLNEEEPGVFADSPGLPAYSPAVGEMFYADCTGTTTIVCRAGDDAVVTFPRDAVDVYTPADAGRYAASADLGDVPAPDSYSDETLPAPSDDTDSDECDPNYEGACLDPNSPDYDCEGGSGDGPDYTGAVTVVGDDPFDLDRDGDGVACEC